MRMTTPVRDVPEEPLRAAAALGPAIRAAAPEIERTRRIPADLLEALREAGLFRMVLPREVGGSATPLPAILAALEEVARHDGSTGWITMIGSGTNYLLTALPPDVVHEVFEADPDIATGGVVMMRGRAKRLTDGYVVSGRWPFGSGCEHCVWLTGGCMVVDDGGEAELDELGKPLARMLLFHRDDVVIHDTWRVAGLRGTGSHDYEVEELFVPAAHSFELVGTRSAFAFPHARLPLLGTLAVILVSVMLGMARGALDTVRQQMAGRDGGTAPTDRPLLLERVARAEGLLRAARAYVFDGADQAWRAAAAGKDAPPEIALQLRLSASHAAWACSEAVHVAYTVGGSAAVYDDSPLQRFQRDIMAAQQHAIIAFHTFEGLGRDLIAAPGPDDLMREV
jgi:indole-3-acetate monooxygenase